MRANSVRLASFVASVLAAGLPGLATGGELAPLWTRDFSGSIDWQLVTTSGQLIVNTAEGLYSIDPATGAPLPDGPKFQWPSVWSGRAG